MYFTKWKIGNFLHGIVLILATASCYSNALASDTYYGPPYSVSYNDGRGHPVNIASFSSKQEAIDWAKETLLPFVYSSCHLIEETSDPYYGSYVQISSVDSEGYDCGNSLIVSGYDYQRDSIRKDLGDPCCNAVGNPVNAGIGNKYQEETDFYLSEELQFVRYYNSSELTVNAHIGSHWRHTYDRILDHASGYGIDGSFIESAVVTRRDGKIVLFTRTDGRWLPETGIQDRLTDRKSDDGNGNIMIRLLVSRSPTIQMAILLPSPTWTVEKQFSRMA